MIFSLVAMFFDFTHYCICVQICEYVHLKNVIFTFLHSCQTREGLGSSSLIITQECNVRVNTDLYGINPSYYVNINIPMFQFFLCNNIHSN